MGFDLEYPTLLDPHGSSSGWFQHRSVRPAQSGHLVQCEGQLVVLRSEGFLCPIERARRTEYPNRDLHRSQKRVLTCRDSPEHWIAHVDVQLVDEPYHGVLHSIREACKFGLDGPNKRAR